MKPCGLFCAVLLLVLAGCDARNPRTLALEGRPNGPHTLVLTLEPARPTPGEPVTFTYHLTDKVNGLPLRELQITHERMLHTFIVARDFSTFAHIHHEDFASLTAQDIAQASFHFPYTFPHPGRYRIVAEYVQRDRSWIKHFDVQIGESMHDEQPLQNLTRRRTIDNYTAELTATPDPIIVDHDIAFTLHLTRDGAPVSDLALLLGTETHVAIWRSDGEEFGHTHSYTPEMATMMARMPGMANDPKHMAMMMKAMSSAPPKLHFPGPDIPVHYRFGTPGLYQMFLQVAPRGKPTVFGFMVKVLPETARGP